MTERGREQLGGAEPVALRDDLQHAVVVAGARDGESRIRHGPLDGERHGLLVDARTPHGIRDPEKLQHAAHEQSRLGAGQQHELARDDVAHAVDARQRETLAGVEGEGVVEHPHEGFGSTHRVVELPGVGGADGDGGDEVVVPRDGERRTLEALGQQRIGDRADRLPGAHERSENRLVDAQHVQGRLPRRAVVLVDETGARDERVLRDPRPAEGVHDVLGHVQERRPLE